MSDDVGERVCFCLRGCSRCFLMEAVSSPFSPLWAHADVVVVANLFLLEGRVGAVLRSWIPTLGSPTLLSRCHYFRRSPSWEVSCGRKTRTFGAIYWSGVPSRPRRFAIHHSRPNCLSPRNEKKKRKKVSLSRRHEFKKVLTKLNLFFLLSGRGAYSHCSSLPLWEGFICHDSRQYWRIFIVVKKNLNL